MYSITQKQIHILGLWLVSNPLSLSDNEHLRSKVQAVYQEEMLVLDSVKICTDKCENLSFSCALKCEIMLKKMELGGGGCDSIKAASYVCGSQTTRSQSELDLLYRLPLWENSHNIELKPEY